MVLKCLQHFRHRRGRTAFLDPYIDPSAVCEEETLDLTAGIGFIYAISHSARAQYRTLPVSTSNTQSKLNLYLRLSSQASLRAIEISLFVILDIFILENCFREAATTTDIT